MRWEWALRRKQNMKDWGYERGNSTDVNGTVFLTFCDFGSVALALPY